MNRWRICIVVLCGLSSCKPKQTADFTLLSHIEQSCIPADSDLECLRSFQQQSSSKALSKKNEQHSKRYKLLTQLMEPEKKSYQSGLQGKPQRQPKFLKIGLRYKNSSIHLFECIK